jgi:hypothetical protein
VEILLTTPEWKPRNDFRTSTGSTLAADKVEGQPLSQTIIKDREDRA